MAKITVNFRIDSDLLTKLETYSTQTGLTVMELIERFCQQGLEMTSEKATSVDARINSPKDNLLTSRVDAIETDIRSILERMSILESKVDVDIDVNDYLQNWENSLELKIASLVDTFVQKRIEEMQGAARRLAEIGQSAHVVTSDTKPALSLSKAEGLLNDYHIDSDDDDEPDEILTDFLKP